MAKKCGIVLISAMLLFTSCAPGPGTEEGRKFDSIGEFLGVFGDVMALPTYYPEGFDPGDPGEGGRVMMNASLTNEAFKSALRSRKETYKNGGLDIYYEAYISVNYFGIIKKECYLSRLTFSRKINEYTESAEYEKIPNHPYEGSVNLSVSPAGSIDFGSNEEPNIVPTKKCEIIVRIMYDGEPNSYRFSYMISTTDEEKIAKLSLELKEWCINEATLMHESLTYWKKSAK